FVVAGIGALVAVAKRDVELAVWTAGAAFGLVLFAARPSSSYYVAPAFVLAFPAVISLVRPLKRYAPLLLAPLAAVSLVPQIRHASDPAHEFHADERLSAAAVRAAEPLLKPAQVVVTPPGFPTADARFFSLVALYVRRTPTYRYS